MSVAKPDFNYSNRLTDSFDDMLERLRIGRENSKWLIKVLTQYKDIQAKYTASMKKLMNSIGEYPHPNKAFIPSVFVKDSLNSITEASTKLFQEVAQEVVMELDNETKLVSAQHDETSDQYDKLKKKVRDNRSNVKKAETRSYEAYLALIESENLLRTSQSDPKGVLANKVQTCGKNAQKCDEIQQAAVRAARDSENELDQFISTNLNKLEKLDWDRLAMDKLVLLKFAGCTTTMTGMISEAMGNLNFSADKLSLEENMRAFVEGVTKPKVTNVTTEYVCQNPTDNACTKPMSGVKTDGVCQVDEGQEHIVPLGSQDSTPVTMHNENDNAALNTGTMSMTQNPLVNNLRSTIPIQQLEVVKTNGPNNVMNVSTMPARLPPCFAIKQIDNCPNYLYGYPVLHPPAPLPGEIKKWLKCKATYAYEAVPEESGEGNEDVKVDIDEEVIVYSMPNCNADTWWQCLKKNGETGQVPSNYFRVECEIPYEAVLEFESKISRITDANGIIIPGVVLSGGPDTGFLIKTVENNANTVTAAVQQEATISSVSSSMVASTSASYAQLPSKEQRTPVMGDINISVECNNDSGNPVFNAAAGIVQGSMEAMATTITVEQQRPKFLQNGAMAVAAYDYDSTNENELTIRVGDELMIKEITGEWALVRNSMGEEGYCLSSFIIPK